MNCRGRELWGSTGWTEGVDALTEGVQGLTAGVEPTFRWTEGVESRHPQPFYTPQMRFVQKKPSGGTFEKCEKYCTSV